MSLGNGDQRVGSANTSRVVSIDVLRGITIAFMILVNDGIGNRAYWPLRHAVWNGWTPTDLVFPTFLFVIGISIVFSTEARLSRGVSKASLVPHIFRRAAVLFLLGLVVNGSQGPHFFAPGTLRIYGVLQRIALCYLFASLLYLYDRRAGSKLILIASILVGYWFLMRWVPIPGFGVPGRDIPLLDPNHNLASYVDSHILPGHLEEPLFDQESILSTATTALANTLLGILAGIWLRSRRSASRKALGMLLCGILGILFGIVWGHWFPINKRLWTSSFVLLSAGWSLVALSFCYWAVDVKNWKQGWAHIWRVFGTNAIAAYMFSELLASTLSAIRIKKGGINVSLAQCVDSGFLRSFTSPHFASLMYSICFVLICYVPIAWLYRRKIFLKI
jgi:predicted acyltransferase